MKISYRIFLGFAVILAGGFGFLISWIMTDVNVQPKKAMEESMVDMAHILASYLEGNIMEDMGEGKIATRQLSSFMTWALKRRFSARIYELKKKKISFRVYVADKKGIVIYDSRGGQLVGRNYARMNDVYLTLRGKYGVRTSRGNPGDPRTAVAYVGAPVRYKGEIIGVCTVAKPWDSINEFIDNTRNKIVAVAFYGFIAVLALSFFISRWITRPIRRLTQYADSVKEGGRTSLPELGKGEVKTLGDSFEEMKESLEGKKYIEKYVQTLTHQLKGPLSGIRGAAELLQEDLPEAERKKFACNIEMESKRIQRIVERMLELSALEQQRELRNVEIIDLGELVAEIAEILSVAARKKGVTFVLKIGKAYRFRGERFLIHQAVFNLMRNALDFTPSGGRVTVEIKLELGRLFLIIRDTGSGIPAYALDKVFDKFYSLQRPDTGRKSSGLGLSLVKEVAALHQGDIKLSNSTPTGAVATLRLPGVVDEKNS